MLGLKLVSMKAANRLGREHSCHPAHLPWCSVRGLQGAFAQHLMTWLQHMGPYGPTAAEMFALLHDLLQPPPLKSKRSHSGSGDGDRLPK